MEYYLLENDLILEWDNSNNITFNTNQVLPNKLFNRYNFNEYLLFNNLSIIESQKLNNSCLPLDEESSIFANIKKSGPIDFLSRDQNITLVSMVSQIEPVMAFNKLKILFTNRTNNNNFIGYIFIANLLGNNNQKLCVLNYYVLFSEDEKFIKQIPPKFITNRTYDKYLEIYLPSLSTILLNQELNPNVSNSFHNKFLDGVGFQESQIEFKVYGIISKETQRGIEIFNSAPIQTILLNYFDKFSGFAANISENLEWNCLEYYPTWNGEFIEEFITNLNVLGGDWVIINDITQYEQVGTNWFLTANFKSLQEAQYSEKLLYRPIIRNGSFCFSARWEYTCKLVNRDNGYEISRNASFIKFNPQKWGKEILQINIENSNPIVVWNKLENLEISNKNSLNNSKELKQISNILIYNNSEILIGSETKPEIIINPISNWIKFEIFNKVENSKKPINIVENINSIQLIIELGNNLDFIKINPRIDKSHTNNLVFFLDEQNSKIIYNLLKINEKTKFWVFVNNSELFSGIFKN